MLLYILYTKVNFYLIDIKHTSNNSINYHTMSFKFNDTISKLFNTTILFFPILFNPNFLSKSKSPIKKIFFMIIIYYKIYKYQWVLAKMLMNI